MRPDRPANPVADVFLWAAGLALAAYLAGAVVYLARWLSVYRPRFGAAPSAGRVIRAGLLWPLTLARADPFRP